VDTFIVEMEPPPEMTELPVRLERLTVDTLAVSALMVDVLAVTKFAVADGFVIRKFPLTLAVERKMEEGNEKVGGYGCPLTLITFIDEMVAELPVRLERLTVDTLAVSVLMVDVLTVTKFAVASALLVFILPCRLIMLALKVLSDVRRPDAWTIAPTTVFVADREDTKRSGGTGGGYAAPLTDETVREDMAPPLAVIDDVVRAGVETQLEPVRNEPLMILEPVRELKFPDSPNTCWTNVSPVTFIDLAQAFPITVEVCDRTVWKPGEPQVRVAVVFWAVMLPVIRIVDIRTVLPMVLTARVLTSADLAMTVEVVRVERVKEGSVGLFWITGTHWPNDWIDDTLLLM
jgi:hypothetical protein